MMLASSAHSSKKELLGLEYNQRNRDGHFKKQHFNFLIAVFVTATVSRDVTKLRAPCGSFFFTQFGISFSLSALRLAGVASSAASCQCVCGGVTYSAV